MSSGQVRSGQVKVAKGHFSSFLQYNRMDFSEWRRSDIMAFRQLLSWPF